MGGKRLLNFVLSAFLSAASGLLLVTAFPRFNLFPVAWVSLLPLLYVLRRQGFFGSLFFGYLTGFVANLGIMYWFALMVRANTDSWSYAFMGLAVFAAYLGLFYGIWAGILRFLDRLRGTLFYPAGAAALWVGIEYLHTGFMTGFPWAVLGVSQWNFLPVVQVSELAGIYGVSFLVVFFNISLFESLRCRRRRSLAVVAGLAALLLAGYVRMQCCGGGEGEALRVTLLQGNIDQYKKWDKTYEGEIRDAYASLAMEAAKEKPDLIVWPETAVPGYVPLDEPVYRWLRAVVRETQVPHLVGAPYHEKGEIFYNGAVLFDGTGRQLRLHRKTHLLPFGEYIPYREYLAPSLGIWNAIADFTPGSEYTVFDLGRARLSATICSENFFGDVVRRFVKNGAEVLVNQTNDAWFLKTSAAEQHFIFNVFRAVENRRSIVVCGNTGITALVDPAGRVTERAPEFRRLCFTVAAAPRQAMTFYTRFGDLFATICIGFSVLLLIGVLFVRRPEKSAE